MSSLITENFSNIEGKFLNYDAFAAADRDKIDGINHVDIRSMRQNNMTAPLTMLELSTYTMGALEGLSMGAIEGISIVTQVGENWNGTVASDSSRGYFNILSKSLTSGQTFTLVSTSSVVNLSVISSTDVVSMALPSFPASSIDLANSGIRLKDTAGNSAIAYFNTSTIALTTGNSEFRVPISQYSSINLSKIETVEIVLKATANCTVRVMSIRGIAQSWIPVAVDSNTKYSCLTRTPPLNGDSAASFSSQFTFWRSQNFPGAKDPKPIDSNITARFNTGSRAATSNSIINIYFRGISEDTQTQLDINSFKQGDLNGYPQPNTGQALYVSRTQQDLNNYLQSEINTTPQSDLERAPDPANASWIIFQIRWSNSATSVRIENAESVGYTLTLPTLSANTDYAITCSLNKNKVRVRLYSINASGVATAIYDSFEIKNSSIFKRRKGRFGWSASILDGDAQISDIQDSGSVFAEYTSTAFESLTPVEGVQIYCSGTQSIELFEHFLPSRYSTADSSSVTRDKTQSPDNSEAWKVTISGSGGIQGLDSNVFEIHNKTNSIISFDIYYPSNAPNLKVMIVSEDYGTKVDIPLPKIIRDQWQKINIRTDLLSESILPGRYALSIVQIEPQRTTWYVANPSIAISVISWQAQAKEKDPWSDFEGPWVPAKEKINNKHFGVLFERGKNIRLNAKANHPVATINKIEVIPKYSEIGKIKMNSSDYGSVPTISLSTSSAGPLALQFTATGSVGGSVTLSDSYLNNFEWSFGDGTKGFGPVVTHTYPSAGTYSVTLLAIDCFGKRATSTSNVTV